MLGNVFDDIGASLPDNCLTAGFSQYNLSRQLQLSAIACGVYCQYHIVLGSKYRYKIRAQEVRTETMNIPRIKGTIPTQEQMRDIIKESHMRSESYGISRDERPNTHSRLSQTELDTRLSDNAEILSQVKATISEFYEFMSPEQFSVAFVDRDEYVLEIAGSDEMLANSRERKLAPGFRWTEKDVGPATFRTIARSFRSIAGQSREICWKASCSAIRKEPLPGR